MRIRVLPYKSYSNGAKTIARALGGKRLRLNNSTFTPRADDVIINWGNSRGIPVLRTLGVPDCLYLNEHDDIARVANKLTFFELMEEYDGTLIPPFWTERESIPDEEFPIVCRTILNGHSGSGIVLADSPNDLVDAPLYVKYVPKKDEYRIHVGRDADYYDVFSVQKKVRRHSEPSPNWQIRNHSNGFNYARNDVNPPEQVLSVARKALDISGLDFGAVDVIWNEQKQRAYVLEINTAPGLHGSTVEDYKAFFKRLI